MATKTDTVQWSPHATVQKYDRAAVALAAARSGVPDPDGDLLARHVTPFEVLDVPGNALTTAGLSRVTALLVGTSVLTLDATRVRLGVGDNATAYAAADAALSLATGQYYMTMDATYPTAAGGVLTFKASYADAVANFAWQCWGLDVGTATVAAGATPNALLVNRKVTSLGTKASGTWVLTVTVTFS